MSRERGIAIPSDVHRAPVESLFLRLLIRQEATRRSVLNILEMDRATGRAGRPQRLGSAVFEMFANPIHSPNRAAIRGRARDLRRAATAQRNPLRRQGRCDVIPFELFAAILVVGSKLDDTEVSVFGSASRQRQGYREPSMANQPSGSENREETRCSNKYPRAGLAPFGWRTGTQSFLFHRNIIIVYRSTITS
jgi:hypothetical protein